MKIDLNKIPDFISKNLIGKETHRIVALVLPFLSLNSTTSAFASLSMAGYQGYLVLNNLQSDQNQNKWLPLALAASSAALGFLCPSGQLALSTCLFLCVNLKELLAHLQKGEWQESGGITLEIAQHLLYTSSQIYRTPLLIALSLISRAGTEFYQAFQEAKNECRKPEIIASLALGALRLYKATSYLPMNKTYVVLFVRSPFDSNGALKSHREAIFRNIDKNSSPRVDECSPKSLKDLERTVNNLKSKNCHISSIIFNCHGIPIAIKPTEFIIKMPIDPTFADDYFLNQSEARRVPAASEYESFDQLVKIIKNGICKNGKVFILSCSSAVSVKTTEKNFTKALAQRLPGIKVTGTTVDLVPHTYTVQFTPKSIKFHGNIFKKYHSPVKK